MKGRPLFRNAVSEFQQLGRADRTFLKERSMGVSRPLLDASRNHGDATVRRALNLTGDVDPIPHLEGFEPASIALSLIKRKR